MNARTASYLTWPDARLRAYLRERGMSENNLPTTRPGLLRMWLSFFLLCIHSHIYHRGDSYSMDPNSDAC